ncbi:MAG: formyltransferase family protein [Bacteroidota bacterium]
MSTILFVSSKSWHKEVFEELSREIDAHWVLISSRDEFVSEKIGQYDPAWIFIPHWSYIIPPDIYENWACVVFHMTDLPFGRGGSPLQNLIANGFTETKITALKVDKEIDGGDIYLKKDLNLAGTAEEIFIRAAVIVKEMIKEIVKLNLEAAPQTGEPTYYKRRKPSEGNIETLTNISDVYDYIRMLDAETYPNAFVEVGNFRFEFKRAHLKSDNSIIADVRITKK